MPPVPTRKKAVGGPTPVEDLRHDDTRANIPGGELAGFVAEERRAPGGFAQSSGIRLSADPTGSR